MRKIVLSSLLALSGFAYADQPLLIERGTPEPMSQTPVAADQYQVERPLQPKKLNNLAELNHSIMLEYSAQKGKFANDIDEDLKGFGIGYSTSPHKNGLWTKFEYQTNKEFDGDAYEFSFGGHLNLINYDGFYSLATLGMGFGVVTADGFDDSNYLTLPVGLEVGYTFMPALSIYGGVGYRWSWDVSPSTTCNNGSSSNSTGSGTCSHNGGINHYNYTIGDFDGLTYKAGVRYNF
ncbi:hypothetical protein [Acinetobacter bereziniae]|uniref:hypothetical protein n=1 Tax=Acinetobacter bereziniae TaxID=106648 RepID=UPI00124FB960|nr:hypothetical protein [Acinetobacter bereziniae]